MQKFINFVYYNVIVYVLYSIVDYIFTFLNLYSSPKLGNSMLVMPTSTDMVFIGINVFISSVLGLYILKKVNIFMDA
jgi:hypothetical protein